jgi:transcription-repair coupling factor (superfamily II helicase)
MDSLKGFHRFLSLEEWGEENEHHLGFSPAPNYSGRLTTFTQESTAMAKEGYRVIVVSQQASRLSELLQEQDTVAFPISDIGQMPQPGSITLLQGSVYGGWAINQEAEPLILFSDAELFGFVKKRRVPQKRPVPRGIFLTELVPGEYVVHIDHGVARFSGMAKMSLEGKEGEYLVLEYAEGDKLYVPSEQVDRVSRYIGPRGYTPALSRLGTAEWGRTKQRVRKATANLAQELLSIYASREHSPGFAFSPDTPWQQELEASFPYIETTDQLEAVQEVKGDMERARPMERLLCGDVGYGKTEVALRAAFKAVLDGMQVALLVPTTVLAQQHFTTFNERLNPFPIRVEMLSRFRPPKGQAEITEGLKCGTVDICIGTHRLLQKDVEFRNLGLVIIDEEQRFGVAHKERLKKLRQEVDVLTLSATPIPRTLHMSLVGIRDLSIMETPPEERLPIKSYVAEYDEGLIREAILRELERGGQVFFVHNRVQTISSMAMKLRNSVPEASFAVAHGQMPEEELESVMLDFVMGKGDVLVCTTIIESGLDLPNVNTIIINDADKLGLTQLYQLRGRVGRGSNRAYAYFLYKRGKRLTDAATKRLRTIFEATELGSGFYIAMKDLEIRGAGNILGAEQSGHMGAVGFELYSQLLAEAVAELKPEERKAPLPPITIDLPLPAFLPEEYIPHLSTRLALYQRLAKTSSAQDAEDIGQELRDRFGEIPQPALNLLYVVKIKALAAQAGIQDISTEGNYVVLKLAPGAKIDKGLMHNLGEGLKIGTTQLRLDMKRHKNWQRILEEVLVRMLLPEEVGSKNLSVQL